VQKAFLCGYDRETERDFSYRRAWIEDLLAYQAGVFAVDVGNFNLLSNHAHTILRTRPDIAATWSDEELALRWKLAWPEFRDGQWIREPTDEEIDALLNRPEKLVQIRRDLSSLSWFMARWKEPIARLCNAEMDRSGHFWESRFGCRELLDGAAVLTGNFYVDLNQVLAGLADSLEASEHSAIRNRILAAKRREALASQEAFAESDPAGIYPFSVGESETLFEDCWLAPIAGGGPLLTADSLRQPEPTLYIIGESWHGPAAAEPLGDDASANAAAGEETAAEAATPETWAEPLAESGAAEPASESSVPVSRKRRLTRRRASDAPLIDVPWEEYERVLRAVLQLKRGGPQAGLSAEGNNPLDAELEATLVRWGLNPQAWLAAFDQLDRCCSRALGAAHRMAQHAGKLGQLWIQGVGYRPA
jgi:hypothetical protein